MKTSDSGNKARRILMLHGSSDIYGASKILLVTASLLKESDYDVYVVLSEDGPLAKQLELIQIKVIICRLGILRRKYFSPAGLANRLRVLSKARKELVRIVIQNKIDLIYSNTTGVLIGAFVARKCKIKHIWHVHEIIKNPASFTKLIGMCLNNYSNKVIVVSNEVKKHWASYVDDNKMVTIHNGLDYTSFTIAKSSLREELGLSNKEIVVGMIGRVNLWKGQKYFIKMASLLAKKYPNVRFVMAGDAYPGYEYLYDELKAIIQKEHLEDRVFDLGFRTDIPNILKGLDIFILPSILPDPLPTVVLEAMASAKPVIATEHGGALEMVENNKTGVLIPWDNAEVAVARFEKLIEDATARNEAGSNGRNRVLNYFSKEQYEKNILATINTL